jgi:hypothetical protein
MSESASTMAVATALRWLLASAARIEWLISAPVTLRDHAVHVANATDDHTRPMGGIGEAAGGRRPPLGPRRPIIGSTILLDVG